MADMEFRSVFYYKDQVTYDSAVAFYHEGLGLPIIEEWDDGPDDRGTKLKAGSGVIEVIRRTPPCPQGPSTIMLEVNDIDAYYQKILLKQLPITEHIVDRPYGIRIFRLADPNQTDVVIFSYLTMKQ